MVKDLANNNLRPDFTSKLVHVLAFGTPKFYTAPYDKIKHELVNLSSNCDVKSGLSGSSPFPCERKAVHFQSGTFYYVSSIIFFLREVNFVTPCFLPQLL